MRSLPVPDGFVGSECFLVDVAVPATSATSSEGDLMNLTLLVDSGLSPGVMLLPRVQQQLGLEQGPASEQLGATGSVWLESVTLEGARLLGREGGSLELEPLPGVVVEDFLQRKFGQVAGIAVDGMVGQGFLEQLDVEFDNVSAVMRVWPAGRAPVSPPGWSSLRTLRLPGELHGLLLSIPGSEEKVVGIVDTGASHTTVNERAATLLGLPELLNRSAEATVDGIGLDGTVLKMPSVRMEGISLAGASHVTIEPTRPGGAGGDGQEGQERCWAFGRTSLPLLPADSSQPFDRVALAIGDISFFEDLLTQPQESIGHFRGAVALLGQDLLGQRAFRMSKKSMRIWFAEAAEASKEAAAEATATPPKPKPPARGDRGGNSGVEPPRRGGLAEFRGF